MTQWGGGNVSGGTNTEGNYFGSLDVWTNLDTAKLSNGLWPGGNIFLHGEVAWGRNFSNPKGIERSVGATIPTNYDIAMPSATNLGELYLSEYYIVQALSPEITLWAGQMNGAGRPGEQLDTDEFRRGMEHDLPPLLAFAAVVRQDLAPERDRAGQVVT